MGTKGFITVATGSDKYYRVAENLLKSYRLFSKDPLPFAILADRENEYTKAFDEVLLIKEPKHSFLDKVYLLNNIPFDETIFVESDCLAYADLNPYFDVMGSAGVRDFTVFGTNYKLNHQFSKNEWG